MARRKRNLAQHAPEGFWPKFFEACNKMLHKEPGVSWPSIYEWAKESGVDLLSPDYIRQGCTLLFRALHDGATFQVNEAGKVHEVANTSESVSLPVAMELKKDGSAVQEHILSQDKLEALFEGHCLSEAKVREFFGISPDFVITSMRVQEWHSAIRGGGKQVLHNLRVTLEPAKTITPELFRLYCDEMAQRIPALPEIEPFEKANEGTYLHVDIADPHFGLLAHKPETGENYDLKIARERTLKCVRSVVQQNLGKSFKQVTLALLGDILHVDNGDMTTAHGTKQDAEGRIPKMLDTTVNTLVECIKMLEILGAPVHVVYVPGNHDTNMGYAAILAVKATLLSDPNVTFDITPSIFKVMCYGQTMLGLSHGEAPKQRAHSDMFVRYRKEIGDTKYSEVHMGHLHNESSGDFVGGVMLRYVPAICASSYWEKSKGYTAAARGVLSFEYHPERGLVNIGRHMIS